MSHPTDLLTSPTIRREALRQLDELLTDCTVQPRSLNELRQAALAELAARAREIRDLDHPADGDEAGDPVDD